MTEEADLAREGLARRRRPLARRRAVFEVIWGGLFVAVAVAIVLLYDADRMFEVGPAAALVAMFALGIRAQINVGVTYTTPVQLAFVPMLLVLPTTYVPLLVLLGWFLGRLPDLRTMHPDRLLLIAGDCWFAVGPVLVLCAGDAQTPEWSDWPVYLAAVAAQFLLELVASGSREWLGEGSPPRLVLRELGLVWGIDALLSPLGLLAAFASQSFQYAFLLLIPPAGLLGLYARERERRLGSALELADAARDRESLIAGASHELVTPIGVMLGLTSRLTGGSQLAPERRAELDVVLHREVLALRQIVRQFVDYTRLKTERDLELRTAPTRLEPLAADVVLALKGLGRIGVVPTEELPEVLVDASRAHQMIMSVTAEALEGVESAHLEFATTEESVTLSVRSAHPLRERPFAEGGDGAGAGLGLHVTRELARLQGGELEAIGTEDGGALYVLEFPRA